MIREFLYKWLQLEECKTCVILDRELAEVKRERDKLLEKLLNKNEPIPVAAVSVEEFKPISTTRNRFIPAAVRQQMMDREDQKTLQLIIDKKRELSQPKITEERIEKLETEIGIGESDASKIG